MAGYKEIILRKPRVPITAENVATLELLDLLTSVSFESLEDFELDFLRKKALKTERSDIVRYAQYYPAKTSMKIIESEAYGVLT